jgi:methionyl aminopeptidase
VIELLNQRQTDAARRAGAFVGSTLAELRRRTEPGTNLLTINSWTQDLITARGAVSCYYDYAPSFGRGPFGKVICTSVNDAVLHGLPHDYVLVEGDLLSLDFAVSVDGVVADAAISFVVGGEGTEEDRRLIKATQDALVAGIAAARVGNATGDISAAIGAVLTGADYTVNTDFGGHGVGTTMHQDPHIPNDGRPGRGFRLRPGLAIAIEPWVMVDTDELIVDNDGWTLRSATGCRTAHTEHTVLLSSEGAEIITLPSA